MAKIFKENAEAREKLAIGVNKISNIVKQTLGPKGRNIAIDRKYATPLITNDGVTIAREFELSDSFENMGVKIIKEVCQKTNDIAGDGTTTAIVLAQKMLNEGLKQCESGISPITINEGIKIATDFCLENIKEQSTKLTTNKEIEDIATISSQNKEIGKFIATAYERLGKDGVITLQDSSSDKTSIIFQEGLSFDKGFVSPYFCNNVDKSQVNFDECFLLLTDQKLNNFNDLLPLLEQVIQQSKPLLIICDDIDEETLSPIVINKMRGTLNVCIVKAPLYGDKKLAVLEDIAALTNTNVCSYNNNINLKEININDLGLLKQAKITKDKTTIITKNKNQERFESRINLIKQQIMESQIDYDKEQLKLRLSNLNGGIATILVGANSDVEQKEKKLRIEDAISATTSALEQGIVAGGGIALFKIKSKLTKYIKSLSESQKIGAEILLKVIEAPLRQILTNANINEETVIEKLNKHNNDKSYGFDANKGIFCNMINSGIIDPAKVTITALKNATSVVTTMLTTESIVCDSE